MEGSMIGIRIQKQIFPIPRHREIKEYLAKHIIKELS